MDDIDHSLAKDAQQVMDNLGGPTAAARLLGVKPSSICAWRKNGISHAWVKYFQALMPQVLVGTRWQAADRSKRKKEAV